MIESAPSPHEEIDKLTRNLSARDSLSNENIVALQNRFPGPILGGDNKRLAEYLIEELATQQDNLSLEKLEERWHEEEKKRKAEKMKDAIGESISLTKEEEELDFEDLVDEKEEEGELTPEQVTAFRNMALAGITGEMEFARAKWMLQQASISPDKTLKELADEWKEKRAKIKEKDKESNISSETPDFRIAHKEGAGAVFIEKNKYSSE